MAVDPASASIPYEACPLCGDARLAEAHVADCTGYPHYHPSLPPTQRWVRCLGCDHVCVDGYFTDEALAILCAELHPTQVPGHDVETNRYVSARMVESVCALRPGAEGGRWLDVGFGNGSLMATATEFGWEVTGIDMREESVRRMRELGFSAHAVDLLHYRPEAPFDVVSLADVLEHLPFPVAALEHVSRIMADGGLLFVSMPNAESFLFELLTRNGVNPYWAELEHYHNFGRRRLYRLLEDTGFSPQRYAVSQRYRACMEVIARKKGGAGRYTGSP